MLSGMKKFFASLFLLEICLLHGATPHAYVTNLDNGTVSVIDVERDTVQKISGFSSPRVVDVTPDGLYAYVGSDDNTLRIIDTSTNLLLPTVIDVNQPSAIAILPNGEYVYVASNDDTVSVVSTTTHAIVATVTGFSNVQDIVVTNARAYVTNAANDTVSVIQTSDNTVIDTITGFSAPLGISITPDETRVYVTNLGNNTISVIRTSDNTVIDTIPGFNSPRYGAVTPDGAYIFVSDYGSNSLIVIRTSDNTVVDTIAIPQPTSVAITPDGTAGYAASQPQAVGKFRTADRSLLRTFSGFSSPSNTAMALTDPPLGVLSGFSGKDRFLLQTEYFRHIRWSPSTGSPLFYHIYRDEGLTDFAGRVDGETLEFIDHNCPKKGAITYYVTALYDNGFTSSVGSVRLAPH